MDKKQQGQPTRTRSNKVKIFSCALILVAAVILGVIIDNATAGSRFESEITAINLAFAKNNTKKIDEVLERTVSSGNYAKVEKSLKKYVRDLTDNINGIDEIADSDIVYHSLEAEYLGKHKDKLNDTISELTKASEKVKDLTAAADKLYNEKEVMVYLEDQNLNESYKKLFTDNAKVFYGDNQLRTNYSDTLKLLKGSVAVEIEAVAFLNERKDDWSVENGELNFKNDNLRKQYIQILEKVAES